MTASNRSQNTRTIVAAAAVALGIAAAVFFLALPGRQRSRPPAPAAPEIPVRSIAALRRDAGTLAGRLVRLRGRIVAVRDLNPGQPFPWDVVYTVDDGTGTLPVHWFVQQQRLQRLAPPVMPDGTVLVIGKLKRDLELEGRSYPLILHEAAELHNQPHPTLPAASPPR